LEQAASVSGEESARIVPRVKTEQVQRLATQQGVPRLRRDIDNSAEVVEEPGPALGVEKRSLVSLTPTGRELKASGDAGADRPCDEVDSFAAEHTDTEWMNVSRAVVGTERDSEINDVVGFEGLIQETHQVGAGTVAHQPMAYGGHLADLSCCERPAA
jgi:hypothetical protein